MYLVADYAIDLFQCSFCSRPIVADDLMLSLMIREKENIWENKLGPRSHVNCMYEHLSVPKNFDAIEEMIGFNGLEEEDQEFMAKGMIALQKTRDESKHLTKLRHVLPSSRLHSSQLFSKSKKIGIKGEEKVENSLSFFGFLCQKMEEEVDDQEKQRLLLLFLKSDPNNKGFEEFEGDLLIFLSLFAPRLTRRCFHLKDAELLALFSRIFGVHEKQMTEDMDNFNGDVSLVVEHYFAKSTTFWPVVESGLSIAGVDAFVGQFLGTKDEGERRSLLKRISSMSTTEDIKTIVRCLKGDPKTGMSDSLVLETIVPKGKVLFKKSPSLAAFVLQVLLYSN